MIFCLDHSWMALIFQENLILISIKTSWYQTKPKKDLQSLNFRRPKLCSCTMKKNLMWIKSMRKIPMCCFQFWFTLVGPTVAITMLISSMDRTGFALMIIPSPKRQENKFESTATQLKAPVMVPTLTFYSTGRPMPLNKLQGKARLKSPNSFWKRWEQIRQFLINP